MRLYRPSIPIETRCRVAMAQLGEIWPERMLDEWRHDMTVAPRYRKPGLGKLLVVLLGRLAPLLGCEVTDLRLDHNPALGLRKKRTVGAITVYTPDANDPEHLLYRSHQAHHIKTNRRGDGALRSDTAQMKYLRRVEKNKKKRKLLAQGKHPKGYRPIPQRKNPWPKREFPTAPSRSSRTSD